MTSNSQQQQYRLLTAWEIGIAQGLPDHWKFKTFSGKQRNHELDGPLKYLDQIYRMIGNGVPVQMACAISRSVEKARFAALRAVETSASREGSQVAD